LEELPCVFENIFPSLEDIGEIKVQIGFDVYGIVQRHDIVHRIHVGSVSGEIGFVSYGRRFSEIGDAAPFPKFDVGFIFRHRQIYDFGEVACRIIGMKGILKMLFKFSRNCDEKSDI